MPPLPRLVKPLPDEPLVAFIGRLSRAMHYSNPSVIRTLAGIPTLKVINALLPDKLIKLSEISGQSLEALYRMTIHSYAAKLPPIYSFTKIINIDGASYNVFTNVGLLYVYRGGRRNKCVCQECVADGKFAKLSWTFRLMPCCLDHKRILTPAYNIKPANLSKNEKIIIDDIGMKAVELLFHFFTDYPNLSNTKITNRIPLTTENYFRSLLFFCNCSG